MATHSSVLAWRIPGTGEPGGLLFMGSHRVGHNWSDLAAVAAAIFHCVYVPQLPYPFICWWASMLLPCPSYCKRCWNEHWGTCVSFSSGFLSRNLLSPTLQMTPQLLRRYASNPVPSCHLSTSPWKALENPRDGGAWWAAVYGVAQSRTQLKRLSSSSPLLPLLFNIVWEVLATAIREEEKKNPDRKRSKILTVCW